MQGMKTEEAILGAWHLVSWIVETKDKQDRTTSLNEPFGSNPMGLILYSQDRWMSATVHKQDRPDFDRNQSPRSLEDSIVAEAFRSYFNYAGPWHIEDACVIHSVQHALNPNMVGTEQRREVTFIERQLQLVGYEQLADSSRKHTLLWSRDHGQEQP